MLRRNFSKTFLKFLRYITLSTLIVLSIFSLFLYKNFESANLESTYRYHQKMMTQLSYNISYVNSVARNFCITQYLNPDTQYLMLSNKVTEFETQKLINRFNNTVFSNNYVHSAVMYNSKLDMFYSTIRGISYNDMEAVGILNQYHPLPYLSPLPRILSTEENYEEIEVFTYFMFDSFNAEKTNNVLIINIKTDWLLNTLKEITGKHSNTTIINKEGVVVLDASSEYRMNDIFNKDYAKDILSNTGESGILINNANNRKKVITYSIIPGTEWILINEEPYETVFEHIDKIKHITLLLSSVFSILAVIISIFITIRMYSPFGKLIHDIKTKMSKLLPNDNHKDDVEYLSHVFNLSSTKLTDFKLLKDYTEGMLKDNIIKSMLLDNSFTLNHYIKNTFSSSFKVFNSKSGIKILLVKLDNYRQFLKMPINDRKLYKFSICNIINEVYDVFARKELIDLGNDEIVIIFDSSCINAENLLISKTKEIQKYVIQYFKLSLSVFIGENITDISKLSDIYRKLHDFSKYKLFYGQTCIVEYEQTIHKHKYHCDTFLYPYETENKLIRSLEKQNLKLAEQYYKEFVDICSESTIENFMASLLQLIQAVFDLVGKIKNNSLVQLDINFNTIYYGLINVEYMDEINDLFLSTFTAICNHKLIEKDEKNKHLVEFIMSYLENNYADKNLSLKVISARVKMSSEYYLNKIFKEYTGLSIQECLNNIRLDKAADLLKYKENSIRAVLDKVGYENESTFYKLFKKKYGVTPANYRLKNSIG